MKPFVKGQKNDYNDAEAIAEVIGFAPAMIVPDEEASLDEAAGSGRMEIVTTTGRRIIVGADVDARALARVVAVLEGR